MAGYKKPAWMTQGFSFRASLRMGAAPYNPGSFEPRYVPKPSGAYNTGGGFESRDVPQPTGAYNAASFESRAVQRPSGQYNPGSYAAPESGVLDVDPWGGYYFSLLISKGKGSYEFGASGLHEVAHFMEMSGMKSTATVFEIEEGGVNGFTHKRAGQSKWDNLQLRYATSSSTFMLEWRDQFLKDAFDQRTKYSGAIQMRRNDGEVLREYAFENAWPVSWEGPALNGGGSELAIETLELAHDGIKMRTLPAATQPTQLG